MVYELSFEGLKDGGTFKVGSVMAAAVKNNLDSGVGKAVVLTGNGEVDYGEEKKAILGIVDKVEYADNAGTDLVATVLWNRTFEGITCASGDAAGDFLVADGSGGLKKMEAAGEEAVFSNVQALSVNGTVRAIRVL